MKSYARRWISLVWNGDIRWIWNNLYRHPAFYGLTLGWLGLGIVVFTKDKRAALAASEERPSNG